MRIRNILLSMVSALVFCSCEALFFPAIPDDDPETVFESLWEGMNERYPFFALKDVDWDKIHTKYRGYIRSDMSEESLFTILGNMLGELKDGHVNLSSSFDLSHSYDVTAAILGESNIDTKVVGMNYLTPAYHTTGSIQYNNIIRFNTLGSYNIAYLMYSSFMDPLSTEDLEYIIKKYPDATGYILDLRGNTGGDIQNLFTLLSKFPSNGQVLYTTRAKSGPGHEDFSDEVETHAIDNQDDTILFDKPVIVLIGKQSYSASSFFAMCTKAYDNVFLMGDATSGGCGLPNAFQLPNGWIYRTPVTRSYAIDKVCYENGVPPDYYVELDKHDLEQGKDSIIEAAISKLIAISK